MADPMLWMIAAAAGLAGLLATGQMTLRGWQGWLDLKRAELDIRRGDATPPSAASRIEVADLKERIRKLEAIASGVDY